MRGALGLAVLLLAASCRDEDVTDDPPTPDNVGASVATCEVVDGAAVADVEVSNGTGDAATYDVTVRFTHDGRTEGTGVGRTPEVAPGRTEVARVRLDGTAAVADCHVESVEVVG